MHYPEIGDFCDAAASILGTTAEQIARLPNIGSAHLVFAEFGTYFGTRNRAVRRVAARTAPAFRLVGRCLRGR